MAKMKKKDRQYNGQNEKKRNNTMAKMKKRETIQWPK